MGESTGIAGWTVTRGRLSSKSSWRILLFMSTYSFIYTLLYVYQWIYFDPAQVLYIYESPAGYGIIIMRLLAWMWFCHASYYTLCKYPEKRQFYLRFASFYSVWFWAGPVTILIGNYVLDNWVREKTANGIENAVAFCGFAMFLVSATRVRAYTAPHIST
jgi:hypothetical protein